MCDVVLEVRESFVAVRRYSSDTTRPGRLLRRPALVLCSPTSMYFSGACLIALRFADLVPPCRPLCLRVRGGFGEPHVGPPHPRLPHAYGPLARRPQRVQFRDLGLIILNATTGGGETRPTTGGGGELDYISGKCHKKERSNLKAGGAPIPQKRRPTHRRRDQGTKKSHTSRSCGLRLLLRGV